MPHIANLPWIFFYIIIALILIVFWTNENFSFSSTPQQTNTPKITNNTLNWNW